MFVVGLGGCAQRLQTTSGVGVLLLGLAGHHHLFTHKRSMCRYQKRTWLKLEEEARLGCVEGERRGGGAVVLAVQTSWRPDSRPTLGLLCKKEEQ